MRKLSMKIKRGSTPVWSLVILSTKWVGQISGFRTPKKSLAKLFSWPKRPIVDLVDPSRKTWNTFVEIALEWKSDLKVIYEKEDEEMGGG